MAKINARGATEVARVNCHREMEGGPVTAIFVLRSDRKVLRRLTGQYGGGYSIFGTLKAELPATAATLASICTKRGWIVDKAKEAAR